MGAAVAFWLMTAVAIPLVWSWRNRPERIAQMADVVGPAIWMSPQRYARIIPSLLVLALGVSFAIVPAWWGQVTGDINVEAYPFRSGDQPVVVFAIVGLALMLLSGGLAISTALWRVPSILVFPFLREDSTSSEGLVGK